MEALVSWLGQAARGALKLGQVVLGLGARATRAQRRERLAICTPCEQRISWRCGECGCLIAAKVKLASSSCGIGKWGAV